MVDLNFPTKTRDQVVEQFKRSYLLRLPTADVRDGMQPDVDARAVADCLMPIYSAVPRVAAAALLAGRTGTQIDDVGNEEDVPRLGASGASGYVVAQTGTSGGEIRAGDEIRDERKGWRYRCTQTGIYVAGDQVPVLGFDVGPDTNQDAGAVLQWSSPRGGVLPNALVAEQSDGSGLTGGRDVESDAEYIARIIAARRRRANSGNDAEYQRVVYETPGIRIEQVFTFPAVLGPGTMSICFTMRPDAPTGSRIPNAVQVSAVEQHLAGVMPATDMWNLSTLVETDTTICLGITWDADSLGWTDTATWPPYYAAGATPGKVVIGSVVTSATVFQLVCANYSGVQQPSIGKHLAVYDAAKGKFQRKTIASFTGTGPWVVTCDTSAGASDTSYTPVAGQRVMPWATDLDQIAPVAARYMAGFGPGEQVYYPPPDGLRQVRSPRVGPKSWPTTVTRRIERDVESVAAVSSCELIDADPDETPLGTPAAVSYLLRLADLAIFPE
jgi:uncharacterized phage protein gp47/JayE